MAPQLFPDNPEAVLVIRKITPDIITLSLPFARFGHVKFGGRGTLIQLTSGGIVVSSPVNLTAQVHDAISSLGGTVRYIVALDLEHHLHLASWRTAFPEAEILAPEGLWEKRQSTPDIKDAMFRYTFHNGKHCQSISEEFDEDFEVEYVYGHTSRELVFLHKPSCTLIEADLLFNLPVNEQYSKTDQKSGSGFLTRLFIPFMSINAPATWQKRFMWHVLSKVDRKAFAMSVQRIEKWDFDRLIPCHGDVIPTGAKDIFRMVFQRFLTM